jgi:hypothetical protein
MNAASAIQEYIEFVGVNEKWDDDAAKRHLMANGVPEAIADDAVRFAPIAIGRAFMESLGVELSNQYLCFRADGSVARSGDLDQNEVFRTAIELAPDLALHPGFKAAAYSSPEVDAVNQALQDGSDAKDLVLGPVALFLEQPTRRGFQTAQEHVARVAREAVGVSPEAEKVPSGRPWWKIW